METLARMARKPGRSPGGYVLTGLLFLAGSLLIATPLRADPILLETGAATGFVWPFLLGGLAIETLILALIIRRPLFETVAVCLLANTITGFIGFVALLLLRIKGIPIFPIGPAFVAATLLEAPMIALMLVRPPIKRIIIGVTAANFATAAISALVLASLTIPAPSPTQLEDLALAQSVAKVRRAIDEYRTRYGSYPPGLTGGYRTIDGTRPSSDPLVASGILQSYPLNPYAPFLRSRRLNTPFLLLGIGSPTRQVELSRPSNDWEERWFQAMESDTRFGDPDHLLLCANGLSDPHVIETLESTFYRMNGADCIPGCFFYRSYDFNSDGLADDYILGAYGWPDGMATVAVDIIDGATGEICLSIDSNGFVRAGEPDGTPEPVLLLHVAGAPAPQT